MDVFSRYLFAYSKSNQDAKINAKVIFNIMTKHAYKPTTIISEKRSAFLSHVIKEVSVVFVVTLKHATTKHTQTTGMHEQSHASIKQALKIETSEIHCGKITSALRFLNTTLLTCEHCLWAKESVPWTYSL